MNKTLERIKKIEWDIDRTQRQTHTRLLAMYLKRAALWIDHFDLEDAWPFFDLAERLAPNQKIPQSVQTELLSYLQEKQIVGGYETRICQWAVAWDEVQEEIDSKNLAPLYEPLLELFEAGGTFSTEHGFIQLERGRFRIGSMTDYLPKKEQSAEHTHFQVIKNQLAEAQANGKKTTIAIQALTISPDDPNPVASDIHYSIGNDTFNHTFCGEYERVANFLGVVDASQDVLIEALQNLAMRTVGDDWVEATLFADIDEDGHGLTYGRYTSNTESNLPFGTDYAVYAVFDTLRRNHAEQAWTKAQFVLTPDGNGQFHIGM